MVFYLTGLGVVFVSVLWILAELWVWSVPKVLEDKIIEWKKKWYRSQGVLSFVTEKPMEEQEHFVYTLKHMLPKLERELGLPVHVEVEINGQDGLLSEEEVRYINCLTRSFSEFTWHINEKVECELD